MINTKINFQIIAYNPHEKTKNLIQFATDFLPILVKQFPIETYYTKTLATLIGIIAENNKHNNYNPIDITINKNNNHLIVTAEDNGPGFKLPILTSIKEKTSSLTTSLGEGLYSLLITTISCGGSLFIQSKNFKETYIFQHNNKNSLTQINLDEIISAKKLPYNKKNNNGLTIKIIIPIKNLNKKTAQINLDKYINW